MAATQFMVSTLRNKHGEMLEHALHTREGAREDVIVIFGHGVTGNMDRPLALEIASRLAEKGWSCVRLSWSGNGNSEGKFEDSCISKEVDDLTAVIDQLKGAKKLVYIGHSMGGAVGALTAAKDDRINVLVSLAGMVRTKTFCETEFGDQIPDSGFMWDEPDCPLSQTYWDDLHQIGDTLTAAREVRASWLMIHGSEDDIVLPQDSVDLYGAVKCKKQHLVYQGTDHSFEGHFETLATDIDAWLSKDIK